jgi:hypothetical protein
MEFFDGNSLRPWAAQFLIVLFLVGGVFVFAVGTGLLVANAEMQRIFATLNRWVSTRRVLRPLEIPRDTTQFVRKYRRWIGAFFIAGACYSIYGLGISFNEQAFVSLLNMQSWPKYFAAWLAASARWILLLGNAAAIVAGIMLELFPDKLAMLETKGGHWFSDRQIAKGADAINDPLDRLVATYPRIAGSIIALVGVLMMADFGFMWFKLL